MNIFLKTMLIIFKLIGLGLLLMVILFSGIDTIFYCYELFDHYSKDPFMLNHSFTAFSIFFGAFSTSSWLFYRIIKSFRK